MVTFSTAFDSVKNPQHYAGGKIRWMEVADDWDLPFRLANALKYMRRYRRKDNPIQDLRKAAEYINLEIERMTHEAEKNVSAEASL